MTLFIYFAKMFFVRIFIVWLFFICLMLIGDTIELARVFGGKGDVNYFDLFLLSGMRVSYFSQEILPFAIFFACLLCLYSLSYRLELVVVRASGISVWQFLVPFVSVAILFGLFVTMIFNPISLNLFSYSKIYESQLLATAKQQVVVRHNRWFRLARNEGIGDAIIRAGVSNGGGAHLTDVSFYLHSTSGKFEDRYDATFANFATNSVGVNGYELKQAIRITPDIAPTFIDKVFIPLQVSLQDIRLKSFSPSETNFWQLQKAAIDAENAGRNPLPFLTRYFHLLSMPLLFLSMVLIAACVSMLFVRYARSRLRVSLGILASFIFYIFGELVLSFGENGLLPIFWVVYFPCLIVVLLSCSLLLYQEDG